MKTPLVQALVADLNELTVHGTAFRIERSSPVAGAEARGEGDLRS